MSLPAVSIDHIGLSKAGFLTLLKLAEKGVRVKATGFGRVDFDVRSRAQRSLRRQQSARAHVRHRSAIHPRAGGLISTAMTLWSWKPWEKKRRRMFFTKTPLLFIGQRRF